MTTLALALFVLSCGWKLYKDWRVTRYAALAHSGHPQYFGAALAAAYLFCVASSVHATLEKCAFYRGVMSNGLTYLPAQLGEHEKLETLQHGAAVAFWVLVLSVLLGWIFNRPLFRSTNLLLAVAKKVGAVDQLQALLHRCLQVGLLAALSLKNGKVYIGVPERSAPFDHDKTWLALWPMASGYRDSSGRLNITTAYGPQYEKLSEASVDDLEADDFRIVIPRSELMTAQFFDLDAYRNFPGRAQEELEELEERVQGYGALVDAIKASVGVGAEGVEEPTRSQPEAPKQVEVNSSQVEAGRVEQSSQAEAVELAREILDEDDLYRLCAYALYLLFITTALLALPQSLLVALLAAAIAAIAGAESVSRVMRIEDFSGV